MYSYKLLFSCIHTQVSSLAWKNCSLRMASVNISDTCLPDGLHPDMPYEWRKCGLQSKVVRFWSVDKCNEFTYFDFQICVPNISTFNVEIIESVSKLRMETTPEKTAPIGSFVKCPPATKHALYRPSCLPVNTTWFRICCERKKEKSQ